LAFLSAQFFYLRDGNGKGSSICAAIGHKCNVFDALLHQSSTTGSQISSENVLNRNKNGYIAKNAVAKKFKPMSASFVSDALKPRYNFKSYEEYLQLQLKKTLNPKLRKLWTSKDWRRKVDAFSLVFQTLMNDGILKRGDKALCIAARVGQEVLALQEVGVDDSIGVDLVPSPPLVVEGDMHMLPFQNESYDFEFSNAFDHALFPAMFAAEVERTLKPGGIAVLHLSIRHRTDKYSANDLVKLDPILELFRNFQVVHVRDIDVFGLDLEIVLRKNAQERNGKDAMKQKCALSRQKEKIIGNAEPLLKEEPLKPWITLKENAKKVKYLPAFTNLSDYQRHFYIDVGSRSYSSSIGSWFMKRYPKQNKDFVVYAIEADKSFAKDYTGRKNVQLLPYAAWVRNESLSFGASIQNRAAEGEIGMGKIQRRSAVGDESDFSRDFQMVQGFDFSEWLLQTASVDDFVVMKMDIEGTEFDLLPKMLETGAICLVDELFLECHYNRWQKTNPERTSKFGKTFDECLSFFQTLRRNGVLVHQWW
jgi:FkbM family methyltransferase